MIHWINLNGQISFPCLVRIFGRISPLSSLTWYISNGCQNGHSWCLIPTWPGSPTILNNTSQCYALLYIILNYTWQRYTPPWYTLPHYTLTYQSIPNKTISLTIIYYSKSLHTALYHTRLPSVANIMSYKPCITIAERTNSNCSMHHKKHAKTHQITNSGPNPTITLHTRLL